MFRKIVNVTHFLVHVNGAYFLTGAKAPARFGYGTHMHDPFIPTIVDYIRQRQVLAKVPKRIRVMQLSWRHCEPELLGFTATEFDLLRRFFRDTPVTCEESVPTKPNQITTTHQTEQASPSSYFYDVGTSSSESTSFHEPYILLYDIEVVPKGLIARLPKIQKPIVSKLI